MTDGTKSLKIPGIAEEWGFSVRVDDDGDLFVTLKYDSAWTTPEGALALGEWLVNNFGGKPR